MGKVDFQTYRKMMESTGGGSNQTSDSSQDRKYVGYFSLKDDGDSSVVRFMFDKVEDLDVVFLHSVKIDGRFRSISCLRDPMQPVSACPLCESGDNPKQRIYIPLISYERDETGNVVAVPKIWERPVSYEKRLQSLISEYGPLSNLLFRVVRNGKAGDTKTTYTEMPLVNKEVYNDSVYVKNTHAFDGYDVIGRVVATLTEDEARDFVVSGIVPDKLKKKASQTQSTQQASDKDYSRSSNVSTYSNDVQSSRAETRTVPNAYVQSQQVADAPVRPRRFY